MESVAGPAPVLPPESRSFTPGRERAVLGAVLLAAAAILFSGLRISLPYVTESDEDQHVERARLVAAGDLNPHWFGAPASTVIYPLAGILKATGLYLPGADSSAFTSNDAGRYLAGRLLTAMYALAALPFVYLVARRMFGQPVALLALAFAAIHPVAVQHAQIVRSDSAATCFGALALWLMLRPAGITTWRGQALAGAAIGLAIASRYFMVVLALPYVALVVAASPSRPARWLMAWTAGGVACLLAFAVTTPYFFLDFEQAWADIRVEARDTHPGADGLSRPANAWWYLTTAGPASTGWPQWVVAFVGAAWCMKTRRRGPLTVALLPAVFIGAISLSGLHWQRWLIPVLPWVACLSAVGVVSIVGRVRRWIPTRLTPALAVAAIVAVIAWPAWNTVTSDIKRARTTTRVLAREWIVANLPAGSRITQEWYGAALSDTGFAVTEIHAAGDPPGPPALFEGGAQYLVVSTDMYGRFFREPERYEREVARYNALFRDGTLVAHFEPSEFRGGPEIRIYSPPRR